MTLSERRAVAMMVGIRISINFFFVTASIAWRARGAFEVKEQVVAVVVVGVHAGRGKGCWRRGCVTSLTLTLRLTRHKRSSCTACFSSTGRRWR